MDGNIALIDSGGGKPSDTTIQSPVVAFVFDVKGLIADISFHWVGSRWLHFWRKTGKNRSVAKVAAASSVCRDE